MTRTNQTYIHKEFKSRLNSENACQHSVQNLLSFSLLFKWHAQIKTEYF